MPGDEKGPDEWKVRYLDVLAELDASRKSWTETEQLLRHGLSRLSLAADRSHRVLAAQLEQLRALLRSGVNDDRLRRLLEDISESIRHMDDQPHATRAADAAPQLRKPGLAARLFGRRTPVAATAPARHPAPDRLELAQKLLQEVIEELAAPPGQREQMLRRVESIGDEIQLFNLGHDLVTLLRPRIIGHEAREIANGDAAINEMLLHLIEHIRVPDELSGRCDAIRALLAGGADADRMDEAIQGIVELIGEMCSRLEGEKSEIEAFLKQMAERLGEIDSGIRESLVNQRESYEQGKELDESVNIQVQKIEESVTQAQDLTLLKAALRERVDVIRAHMQQYRRNEEGRIARAEGEVAQLNERLQNVQRESDLLRQRLRDQRELAMVDTLTGIPNRFAYNERLKIEFARWRRYQSPLVLSMWDIDRFKEVNDHYGHQAGDKALKVIARLIRDAVRDTDFVARYGGEEFVLLMPETGLDNGLIIAEGIRRAVESCGFHFRGKAVPITISCGLSEFRAGDRPEQVFARADEALYKAKLQGRNGCSTA
ncbi:diguanylate cyclase [Thioalkalivibrio sp.]|uniref:diguanylate cyclase n=1 Tax=Thioalkalivibrio sp. TaxID=2093813 RepID=UPI0039771A79